MGALLGPVHTGLLPAKSAFSAKGKTFGVGFQLRRPPAKQQCPRSQRQPRPSLALRGAEGHCIKSCCMESPAFNRDALGHDAKKSTAFNRDALGLASWTPVHTVGIHCTTMHGILCIQ